MSQKSLYKFMTEKSQMKAGIVAVVIYHLIMVGMYLVIEAAAPNVASLSPVLVVIDSILLFIAFAVSNKQLPQRGNAVRSLITSLLFWALSLVPTVVAVAVFDTMGMGASFVVSFISAYIANVAVKRRT